MNLFLAWTRANWVGGSKPAHGDCVVKSAKSRASSTPHVYRLAVAPMMELDGPALPRPVVPLRRSPMSGLKMVAIGRDYNPAPLNPRPPGMLKTILAACALA